MLEAHESECMKTPVPLLWQLELGIQIDQIRGGSTQVFDVNMATISKCQLISSDCSTEMTRGLRWPKAVDADANLTRCASFRVTRVFLM